MPTDTPAPDGNAASNGEEADWGCAEAKPTCSKVGRRRLRRPRRASGFIGAKSSQRWDRHSTSHLTRGALSSSSLSRYANEHSTLAVVYVAHGANGSPP